MLSADDLRLVSPEVLRLSARHERAESHVEWWVDYAPEPEEEGGRAVFGTLHAFEPAGGGEVTVASIVMHPDTNPTSEEFEAALRGSDAVETLYDFARTVLRSITAIVDAKPEIGRAAPEATYGLLARASELEDADAAAASD